MKLLVLGAGVVGKSIAQSAAAMPIFHSITVADYNLNRAQEVARLIGAQSIQVDASEHSSLVEAMKQADMVISAIGPATRFGVSTLRAAIEARRTYIDITDDPVPTLEMLKLDAEAKSAGVIAIIGTGASPGIANLLAVAAGRELDQVNRLLTGWGSGGDEGIEDDASLTQGTNAALQHWVEQCSGKIPTLIDGKIDFVESLQPMTVDFPGIGSVQGRTVGHPEPVTLKRRFPELKDAANVMNFSDFVFEGLQSAAKVVNQGGSAADGAKALAKYFGEGADLGSSASIFARTTIEDLVSKVTSKLWLPPLWALAEGKKNGHIVKVGAQLSGYIPGGTGPMTGIPCAVIASIIGSGLSPIPGVHSVETAVDPDRFFATLCPFLRDEKGRSVENPIVLSRSP